MQAHWSCRSQGQPDGEGRVPCGPGSPVRAHILTTQHPDDKTYEPQNSPNGLGEITGSQVLSNTLGRPSENDKTLFLKYK